MAIVKSGGARRKFKARMDIEEMNAKATAYGRPIGKMDYLMYVGVPGLLLCIIVTLLYFSVFWSILAFIVGMIYGFKNYMPHAIERKYLLAGMNARGHYLTVTTQLATNDEKSMLMVLDESVDRVEKGTELHKEIVELVANIGTNIEPANVRKQFASLRYRYRYDSIFCQYLEQLETGLLNGNNNIDTLQEIEQYHSNLRAKTHDFLKKKDANLSNYKLIGMFILALVAGCAFLLGFDKFRAGFSRTPVGLIFGLPFLALEVKTYLSFYRDYWDDDIMSIRTSNKKDKNDKRGKKGKKGKK